MPKLRSTAKRILEERAGLSIQRREDVPFGADWTDDLAHYLGAGKHRFIDVGANEGQTVSAILRRFPEAEIHSFEPVPETYERLTRNVAGSGVRTVNSALGATAGRETIFVGEASGLSGFHGSGEKVEIAVTTLDAYAGKAFDGPVDLLKIDTEGHETAVLEGASNLLGAGLVSHVLAECEFDSGPHEPHGDFREIADLLAGYGFRVVAFYCEGVDDLGWRWGDVLFRRVTPALVATHPAEEFAGSPFHRS